MSTLGQEVWTQRRLQLAILRVLEVCELRLKGGAVSVDQRGGLPKADRIATPILHGRAGSMPEHPNLRSGDPLSTGPIAASIAK